MDLLSFLRVVRRHVVLVIICVLAGASLGAATTLVRGEPAAAPRRFVEASQVLTVVRDQTGSPQSGFASLDQIAPYIVGGDVPRAVAERLGGDPSRLVDRVTVTSNDFLGTLAINVVGTDEDETQELAAAFGAELVANLDEQLKRKYDASGAALEDRRATLRNRLDELDAQLATLPADSAAASDVRAERDAVADRHLLTLSQLVDHTAEPTPTSPVQVLDEPQTWPIDEAQHAALLARGQSGDHLIRVDENGDEVGAPSGGSGVGLDGPVARGLAGALLGLLAGLGLAFGLDSVDRRIRTRGDLEAALGLPVLAEVPAVDAPGDGRLQVLSYVAPFSYMAEAYRAVRSALLFELTVTGRLGGPQALSVTSETPHQATVIMVVSAIAGEGKTTTTANLAVAFAETGASVLVIGGDFRRPTLHRMFGIDDLPGAVFDTGIPGVDLVTSVQVDAGATPAQVVDAQRRLVIAMAPHYDVVLVDTAPLLSTNDAIDLAPLADLLVVVARYGVTKTHHERRAAEILARIRRPVGGAVFIGTGSDHDGYSAYYGELGERLDLPSAAAPSTVSSPAAARDGGDAAPVGSERNGRAPARASGQVFVREKPQGSAASNGHDAAGSISWHPNDDTPRR